MGGREGGREAAKRHSFVNCATEAFQRKREGAVVVTGIGATWVGTLPSFQRCVTALPVYFWPRLSAFWALRGQVAGTNYRNKKCCSHNHNSRSKVYTYAMANLILEPNRSSKDQQGHVTPNGSVYHTSERPNHLLMGSRIASSSFRSPKQIPRP